MVALLRRYLRRVDALYLALCAACSAVSVVVLVSIGQTQLGSNNKASVQLIASFLGIMLAVIFSTVDYRALARAWPLHATVAWGLVLPTLFLHNFRAGVVTIGYDAGGTSNYSWYRVGGMTFQPAELAKIAVIIMMAYMIGKMGRKVKTLKSCMILGLPGAGLALAAYVLTDNLSTAMIILGITVGMVFVAHPKMRPFIIIGIVGIVLIVIGVLFLVATTKSSNSFRIMRVLVWLQPEKYSDEGGYQTLQALYAIGSGGFFGRGLGNSIQKLGSVPEAQNDMIFSIICEELGIFGGIFVLILFGYLLYRLFFIAQNAPDLFGSLIVTGIFIHIALQVILNIAVVLNLMPNTGVTLPFISYGGTSIVFLMSEMAIALSVARQIKFQE